MRAGALYPDLKNDVCTLIKACKVINHHAYA